MVTADPTSSSKRYINQSTNQCIRRSGLDLHPKTRPTNAASVVLRLCSTQTLFFFSAHKNPLRQTEHRSHWLTTTQPANPATGTHAPSLRPAAAAARGASAPPLIYGTGDTRATLRRRTKAQSHPSHPLLRHPSASAPEVPLAIWMI